MIDLNDAPVLEDAEDRKLRVKAALQNNIRGLVRHLYPKAIIQGQDARIGDIDGQPGHSMSIALSPLDKAGMWKDHATDERGDVYTLIERALGLTRFSDVLGEAEAYLGGSLSVRQVEHGFRQSKIKDKPPRKLIDEQSFIYRDKAGKKVATVYRRHYDDGSKGFPVQRYSDAEWTFPEVRLLYRLNEWHNLPSVVLVEGEKCADALFEKGIAATSLMGGANALLDKTDLTPLAGKTVTLWPDNDEPGFKLMAKLKTRLEGLGCTVLIVQPPSDAPSKWDAADATPGEVETLLRVVEPAKKKRLPVMSVSDLASMKPPSWLVDSMLVEGGMSALYAPSETFKSFIALDIALSIACGQDWRGKAVVPGPVVYMIGEGVAGWPARVLTWLQRRAPGVEAPFWTIPTSIALTEPEDAVALVESVQEVCEKPALIVVDTLARNFGGGDENSTQDMNAFVAAVDHIREVTGAHVMLIHHTGKDAEKGGRGSSVLRAALDTEMQCHRPDMQRNVVTFSITKQKDIEKADPLTFEMTRVEGFNPVSGEVFSSLVPVLLSAEEVSGIERTIDLEILGALSNGPKTIKEVGEITGRERPYLSKNLSRMEKEGVVFADRSQRAAIWSCVPQSVPEENQQNQENES